MSVRLERAGSQKSALERIATLVRKGSIDRRIVAAARALTMDCEARDDECELRAIYDAVKKGDDRVAWLRSGMRYVADPRPFDTFSAVSAIIEDCSAGSCAGDCDDHVILVASLCSALGFQVGVRAWGKSKDPDGDYTHVYSVVMMPKSGPWPRDYYGHGMDTTVGDFDFGDEPGNQGNPGEGPGMGHFMTAWVL